MTSTEIKRNQTIDILRCIGLFLVIAAHCDFPDAFINFREFDVVLLMFVSGAAFQLTSRGKPVNYWEYVHKRFRKLVLPVWAFLTLFFVFFFILGRTFSILTIVSSYLLLASGILFVWVYRVFFTTALINPFWKDRIRENDYRLLLVLILILLVNDASSFIFSQNLPGLFVKIFQYIVTYTISYSIISAYGMIWLKMEKRGKSVFIVLFGITFVLSGALYGYISFYEMKYPPTMYYISYGLFCSGILYLLFSHVKISEALYNPVQWLSNYTMTIYLWHIVFYYLLDSFFPHLQDSGILSFLIYMVGSIVCTWIQKRIIQKMREHDEQ